MEWKDQIWEYPNRYRLQQNANGSVDLLPEKGQSLQDGTPVNAQNLPKIRRRKQTGKWIDTSTVIPPKGEYVKKIPLNIDAKSGKIMVRARYSESTYDGGGVIFFTTNKNDTVGSKGNDYFNLDGENLATVGYVTPTWGISVVSAYINDNNIVIKIVNSHSDKDAQLAINHMYWEVEE